MKSIKQFAKIFSAAAIFLLSAMSATAQTYQSFGDSDSVIAREVSVMPSAPTASVQSSSVISQTASTVQFPTQIVVDQAAAAAAKFWSAARIAALGATAAAAVSVLASSSVTSQH
jgi:hypothetical protein